MKKWGSKNSLFLRKKLKKIEKLNKIKLFIEQILHVVLKNCDNTAAFVVVGVFSILMKSAGFCYSFTKFKGEEASEIYKNICLKVKFEKLFY